MSETAARLSDHVLPKVPVRQWVLSLPMPLRYWLASNPKLVTSVLEILMRTLRRFYRRKGKKAGVVDPQTGAITFVQRFGSALNLNVHFHLLFLDGIYSPCMEESPMFHPLPSPSDEEIRELVQTLALRITRHLKRKGYLRETEDQAGEGEDPLAEKSSLLASCVAASIQNKVAMGERAGKYVRKLGVHPIEAEVTGYRSAAVNGFSLHGGIRVAAEEREKLEHLIRYVARPAVALERLEWASQGNLIYKLKKSFSDGTTHVLFSPMELMEKLAAIIPQPKIHLVRYHGVLAPHAALREHVVPKKEELTTTTETEKKESSSKRISWARLLKRVFDIDISTCSVCQGKVKVIAAILERSVIRKILKHLGLPLDPPTIASARAPPEPALVFDPF